MPARVSACKPPNCLSSSRRFFGPSPGMSSSGERVRAFCRRARWPVIANRCASSRSCWIKCNAGELGGKRSGSVRSGKYRLSRPGLRSWPFATPTSARARDLQLLHHADGARELAGAAVDEQHVGHRHLALLHARVAPRQHLRHRAVVVAGRDVVDVEAPIVRLQRPFGPEHDARRDGRLAGRVAHVEALEPRRQLVELERLGQRLELRARTTRSPDSAAPRCGARSSRPSRRTARDRRARAP